MRVFQPGNRAHDGQLHVERQGGRNAVGVDLVGGQAFRLEEDLVAGLVGETGDLVLDRRAVARPHPFDDAGIHRRAIEAAADDFVGCGRGVGDPARALLGMHRRIAHEGKHRRRIVARLLLGLTVIDGAAVDARRCAGLQPANRQIQFAQAGGQRHRGRIAHAPGLEVFQPHMHQTGKEGAGGQHHRAPAEHDAELGFHADDAVAIEQQVVDRLLEQREIGLVFQPLPDRRLVQHPVGLRAGGAYRRPLGGIQGAELDARLVGGDAPSRRPARRPP